MEYHVLGIDIGASGMKGAIVDMRTGMLVTERIKLDTPHPATPEAMLDPFMDLVKMHEWKGKIGCGFPAIIKKGVALSASNIDENWINVNAEEWFGKPSGCPVKVINDADAAGIAEVYFGAGKGYSGSILLITIGTGLGSALVYNGQIMPNTELGHMYLKGQSIVAEKYAANSVRKNQDLSWEEWGTRFNEYLVHICRVIVPDRIILGGGISKKYDLYKEFLNVEIPIEPAHFLNNAGIIGAAWYAYDVLN